MCQDHAVKSEKVRALCVLPSEPFHWPPALPSTLAPIMHVARDSRHFCNLLLLMVLVSFWYSMCTAIGAISMAASISIDTCTDHAFLIHAQ
jgi:hypothetical protein